MPKATLTIPSRDWLNETFTYNPETGELIWREQPLAHFAVSKDGLHPAEAVMHMWNTRFAGKRAGCIREGRWVVTIKNRVHVQPRIIWKMIYDDPVPDEVDHKDTNPLNNQLSNLRAATSQTNAWNRTAPRNNTSGFKGVSRYRGRWRARIRVNGVEWQIGVFDTPEEAHAAYCEAAGRLHGEFARWE